MGREVTYTIAIPLNSPKIAALKSQKFLTQICIASRMSVGISGMRTSAVKTGTMNLSCGQLISTGPTHVLLSGSIVIGNLRVIQRKLFRNLSMYMAAENKESMIQRSGSTSHSQRCTRFCLTF